MSHTVSLTQSDPFVIIPNWPAPANIKAFSSTRIGGYSEFPYGSLNLGAHVGDDIALVTRNRQHFMQAINMPTGLRWLKQVHGTRVIELPTDYSGDVEADAAFSRMENQVCAVMTADCLPLLFCNTKGTEVAACHAGWRGLCHGVIEQTLAQFSKIENVMVWLGPAIGPRKFEVGNEVKEAFMSQNRLSESAFLSTNNSKKWLANLYLLARQRLENTGIQHIYGGEYCTYEEEDTFFSYRRDKDTGRMASVIWLEDSD